MTDPQHDSSATASSGASSGAPVDDRRADSPAPASTSTAAAAAPATEAERETAETVRSISRLEESN